MVALSKVQNCQSERERDTKHSLKMCFLKFIDGRNNVKRDQQDKGQMAPWCALLTGGLP